MLMLKLYQTVAMKTASTQKSGRSHCGLHREARVKKLACPGFSPFPQPCAITLLLKSIKITAEMTLFLPCLLAGTGGGMGQSGGEIAQPRVAHPRRCGLGPGGAAARRRGQAGRTDGSAAQGRLSAVWPRRAHWRRSGRCRTCGGTMGFETKAREQGHVQGSMRRWPWRDYWVGKSGVLFSAKERWMGQWCLVGADKCGTEGKKAKRNRKKKKERIKKKENIIL